MSAATGPAPPPERVVWIDGALCRGRQAALSVFDRGARDGEGLFETLRLYGGRPFLWERHLERLVVSAAELGFPVPAPPAALRGALDELLEATGLRDAVARVTVTRGIPSGRRGRRTRGSAWVEVEPLAARLWKGVRIGRPRAIVSRMAFHPGPLGGHKTTSRLAYHLAREEARAAGADEALLAGEAGLLEGSASNLFLAIEGTLVTPPHELGILPGITRRVVLDLCARLAIPAAERPIALAELDRAAEAFLTNSVQEVVPLAEVGARRLPGRTLGTRLAEAYRDDVRRRLGPGAADAPAAPGN